MTVKARIEKLERCAGAALDGDPGDPPPIVLHWGDQELTPEQAAQQAEARAWYARHGWPDGADVVLQWAT
jgi:hypothetical protein